MNVDPSLIVDRVDHRLATELLTAALDKGDFSRSVGNCHTAGLDSIVLFDRTADRLGMVRFFWAKTGGHKLTNLYDRQGHFFGAVGRYVAECPGDYSYQSQEDWHGFA